MEGDSVAHVVRVEKDYELSTTGIALVRLLDRNLREVSPHTRNRDGEYFAWTLAVGQYWLIKYRNTGADENAPKCITVSAISVTAKNIALISVPAYTYPEPLKRVIKAA